MHNKTNIPKQYLSIKEVSNYLGLSENTIRKYVWLRTIPYTKVGSRVLFNLETLNSWIEKKSVLTYEEIQYGKK